MSNDLWQQATAFSFAADKERKGGTRVVACKRAYLPEELLQKGQAVIGHSDATHNLLDDNPDVEEEQRLIDTSGLQVQLPAWLQHTEDQAFAFGAAVMFTVLSKCGGDDAVVVVDSCPPVAVLNPCALAPLRDELFPDLVCDVTVKRNSDESLDAGRTSLANKLSAERSVGFCAIVLQRTVERVGLDVFAQAFDVILVLEFKGSHAGTMNVDLYYNSAVYHQTSATWWLQMLQSIIGTKDLNTKTVNELTVFDGSMKKLLLQDWQPEMIDSSEYNRTAQKLFAHTMKKHCTDPKTAVCVVEPGRMTLTYDQVDVISNKIASYLQNVVCKDQLHRFGEDAACALHMPRCAEWYCWMLGILKAGGAYLSLDPDFPANRLSYILEDSGAVCLITVSKLAGSLEYNGPVICIDQIQEQIEAVDLKANPYKDLATPTSPIYMIYTSGSTGKPKGVLVEHRNLCNFVISERRMFQLGNHHKVIQGFSTSFDASLEEIWLAFASGSALVCVAKSIMQDAEQLQELITETKASVLSTVPTLLATMEASKLKQLELVIVGGEACNKEVIEAYATGGKRMFVNSYGPTEATVACCAAFCKAGQPVTIGRAQPGYAAYIVDEAMRLTPPGVPGELCMAGPSVTRGYVNRPELTREKFIHCPFHESYDRMYRTGDLCRWNVNGNIEFLGRIDSQVKLRGFRIEIGEIETNLATFPGVTTAVVILRNDAGGMPYLCAYLICEPQLERDFSENKFRQHLATLLPTYMIPSRFVAIKVIPRSPAGKLDRNGFPPPEPPKEEEKKDTDESAKKAPSTDTERLLHEIWTKHLPNITIGVHDNFFEIGGHSLLAGKVASDIRKSGFEGFSIRYLYSHPTIETLATATESMRNLTKAEPVCTQLPFRKDPSFLRRCVFMLIHLVMMHFVFCISSAYVLLYLWVAQRMASQLATLSIVPLRLAESLALCLALVVVGMVYSFCFVPMMKWIILGRVKPGMHSIWSWFFVRWWTVRAFANMVPLYGYSGTSWSNLYLRLMGMQVGRGSVYFPGGAFDFDLISLGEDVCIGHESVLSASEVIDSVLVLRPITIGDASTVGVRCCVKGGSIIGSECRLGHLSLLRENNVMKDGEVWEGSPAQVVGKTKPLSAYQPNKPHELSGGPTSRTRNEKSSLLNDEQTTLIQVQTAEPKAVRLSVGMELLLMFGQFFIAVLLSCVTTFPVFSMMLSIWQYMNDLRGADMAIFLAECFAAAPFAIGLMFVYLHLILVILRWIVLPWKVQPGNYPVNGLMYHRKVFFDLIMRVSLGASHPLYASIYVQYLLKLLGAEVGNRVECSNLYGFTPGLTKFGNETFVADFVGVNPPEVFRGVMVLGRVEIKDRAFVGNGAVLSQGRTLNERSLLGLLSHTNKDLEEGSTYIGSPAFHIPRQAQNQGASSASSATYDAPCHLFIARCIWEYFRTVTPATLLVYSLVCAVGLISATIADIYDVVSFAKFMSLFVWLATIPPLLLILVIKWVIVGREKPAQYPLWSSGVWRAEFVVDCTTVIGGITFLPLWRGTPLMPLFFRALGAKIGSGCYIDTIFFTEPDMVTLGDHCCIGDRVTLQTHLFEDRVMKLDYLVLDDRVTVGPLSIVLYSTTVGRGCSIGSLSLVMKGESYPPGTHWEGVPAQRRTVPSVMAVAAASMKVPHTATRPLTRDARPSSIKPQGKVDTATLKDWLLDDGLQTFEDAYY